MKKFIYLLFLLQTFALNTNAQNYKDDGKPYDVYCIVAYFGSAKNFSAMLVFDKCDKKNFMVDQNGDKIVFNSCADLFTYMGKRGWKLVPSSPSVSMTGYTLNEWLFVKTVISDSDAKEGLYVESDFKK